MPQFLFWYNRGLISGLIKMLQSLGKSFGFPPTSLAEKTLWGKGKVSTSEMLCTLIPLQAELG